MALDQITSQSIAEGAITVNDIADGSITHSKLHTTAIQDKLGYTPVSPTQLTTEINNLIAGAPGALNTLDELAAALGDDANYAATITNALAAKADTSTVNSALALKANTSSLGTLASVSPTGTANTTTFLRGDNSWQVVAVTPTAVSDQTNSSTGYFDIPHGTTAQRPGSPNDGMMRYNSTLSTPEIYSNGAWNVFGSLPGSTAGSPAESALQISQVNPSATNGFYWIRQTGSTAFQHYCVFRDANNNAIQGGPWTVPFAFNGSHNDLSTNGPTAATQFAAKCTAIGISTPGRGMESSRSTTEVYGAWLAVKRAIWDGYTSFVSGKSAGSGGVIAMPMVNINGEGGSTDHRLIYNTSFNTHIPPNVDGDACNANQLYCGWWGVNDVSSWTTNNNAIPGPEDWGPGGNGGTNTTYGYSGVSPLAFSCVYR